MRCSTHFRMGSSPSKNALSFLIVDDDEDAHFFLRRDLKRCGLDASVHSVLSGEAAVEFFKGCLKSPKALPDLVFLDIKMPGMNGFAVLEWARDQGLLGKLTLAMLSSSEEPKDVTRAMSLGAHTYLTKPATAEQLKKLAESVLKLKGPENHGGTQS